MNFKKTSKNELAECFGVDLRTITNWCKEGMPRLKSGLFCLPACIKWRLEKSAKPDKNDEEKEKDKWLAAVRREQARMARLERLEKEGSLVSLDTSLQILSEEVTAAKNALRGVGRKVAPRLVGLDVREIEAELNEEHDQILKRLARRSAVQKKKKPRGR